MSNVYADVVRLEGTETGLSSIQRAGSDSFATDTRKMLRKFADGTVYKWTPDSLFTVDASDVTYTNTLRPTMSTVKAGLDVALAAGDYFADIGVTGIPYWGDGIIDQYVTRTGSAVYSQDSHVYFMGEGGFTGMTTQFGCRFVITPVPPGDVIKFVHTGANVLEYSDIGYTGSGTGDGAELHVTSRAISGSKANLLLKAYYGKVKIETSVVGSGNDGVVLVGKDDAGTSYDSATGVYCRAMYTDADGEVVISTSDQAKYKEAGFTATCVDTSPNVFAYCKYVINGKMCMMYVPTWSGNLANSNLSLQVIPAEARPATEQSTVGTMMYEVGAPGVWVPSQVVVGTGGVMTFYPAAVVGDTGVGWTYPDAATGLVGAPPQCLSYSLF